MIGGSTGRLLSQPGMASHDNVKNASTVAATSGRVVGKQYNKTRNVLEFKIKDPKHKHCELLF
jgi:hypothetical protein